MVKCSTYIRATFLLLCEKDLYYKYDIKHYEVIDFPKYSYYIFIIYISIQ